MTNLVDTTAETQESEWDMLVSGAGIALDDDLAADTSAVPEVAPMPEGFEVEITAATIEAGIRFAFAGIGGLKIDDEHYAKLSEAWARVIVRRFGGLAQFLEKYGDIVMAGGASLSFTVAVVNAVRVEKSKKLEKEQREAAQKIGKHRVSASATLGNTQPDPLQQPEDLSWLNAA